MGIRGFTRSSAMSRPMETKRLSVSIFFRETVLRDEHLGADDLFAGFGVPEREAHVVLLSIGAAYGEFRSRAAVHREMKLLLHGCEEAAGHE